MAVGIPVKRLGKGCEQAGNGGCDHGMAMVRIMICGVFTMIVISRSCLFRFFTAVLFLHYPIRQVGKGKVFGFLQNRILKFTKIQV